MWPAVPRMSGLTGSNAVEARVRAQGLGNDDRAVCLLVILEQRDQRARDRHRGPVQRVHELVLLAALAPEARLQAARLEVGAVRGAGHLAPVAALAAPGNPGLEVELAVGGRAQVARGDVDHAVGHLERRE